MRKLIVQIPCLNEEATLAETVRDIPRVLAGVDRVEILVVDDGSTDRTVEVARLAGVDHIVRFTRRKGLAATFMAGLDAAIRLGADYIVNTDGDNQYAGRDIPKLLAPLLDGSADVVIGDRQIGSLKELSITRRTLQQVGSWVVRQVSSTKVPDTTSGFRAFTREAAMRLNVVSEFTYTLETIIQAGKKRMAIDHVPVETNPRTRDSRLFDSVWDYLKKSVSTIVRIYSMYEPLKVFSYIGSIIFALGLAISLRFLYYFLTGTGTGHLQSLILSAVLLIVGFQILLIGLVADLISSNRKLLEDLLYRVRLIQLGETERPRELAASGAAKWNR